MDPRLEDLRILRLAAMYEAAFESFVVKTAERDVDADTRARLDALQPGRDRHEARIRDLLERLERSVPESERLARSRAALVDVVEVERAAREFYLRNLDRVHDPDVVRLFHELAAEEGAHVRIAEQALDALGAEPRSDSRLQESLDIPIWEGVSDLDRSGRRTHAKRSA